MAISRRNRLASLNAPSCGIKYVEGTAAAADESLFVTNGADAQPGQFPWAASLRYSRPGETFGDREHKCGGTLVKDR